MSPDIKEKIPNVIGFGIIAGLIFVVSTFIIDVAIIEKEDKPVQIIDPFIIAENYVQDGNLHSALKVYTEIIQDSPGDEVVWHQKGKILNRLGLCDEAISHYLDYLDRFPKSTRGQEGYEVSKQCK